MGSDEAKQYWKGIEEREQTAEFEKTLENEFPELPVIGSTAVDGDDFSRRSFLKAAGFSVAGSLLVSCTAEPVRNAIPLLVQKENMTPGQAYWYASTCGGCQAGCGILVKNRDGRPIKIEGNPDHPISRGGLCAVGQAMVLGVYDSHRLSEPSIGGKASSWETVDESVRRQLAELGDRVVILTGTVTSPSTQAMVDRFLGKYVHARHVTWDAVSYSAILDAHAQTHGARVLPHYRFEKAEVIVGLDADFLGTWVSPVEFTKTYTERRGLGESTPDLSYHIQVEGRMSLTGSNADRRIKANPSEYTAILGRIARGVADRAGVAMPQVTAVGGGTAVPSTEIDEIVDRLWSAKGKSLLVCGINDVGVQCIINAVNHLLGNYGATVDVQRPSRQWQGDDGEAERLIQRMQAGQVNALIIADANPAYCLPDVRGFTEALKNVNLTISLTQYHDETSRVCQVVCPANHPLESWDDSEAVSGTVSVSQPVLSALGKSRSLRACLGAWLGETEDDLKLVQSYWRKSIYPRARKSGSFQSFWDKAVHDGVAEVEPLEAGVGRFSAKGEWPAPVKIASGQFTLALYEKIGIRDGRHAHNPWLQELPDPVTKVVWDNYVSLAPSAASGLSLEEGDVVEVKGGGFALELPVQLQPGQHPEVAAIALGYGRAGTDRFEEVGPQWLESRPTVDKGGTVGVNAFAFASWRGGSAQWTTGVALDPIGKRVDLAMTQTHHTITVPEHLGGHRRNMVRETTLDAYREDPASGNHYEHQILQLWADDYVYDRHHWGLAIDLSKCTGCSACVVACQAENNVPVVGRDEVYRRRDMHWIRIDRYYSGTGEDVDVMHQPVMCQHCDHAPCEAVCPVLATVHSDEGINQQIYNRCVGTRYCANNCPYKVRRFNWFDNWRPGQREHLALNPDITTRTRGVMEKCSLCVQRIQAAKADARRSKKPLGDGDIQLACQQSCPAGAIVFGDMNDPKSRIASLNKDPRHYRMLEEMNYRPTVGYMTKVRNRSGKLG